MKKACALAMSLLFSCATLAIAQAPAEAQDAPEALPQRGITVAHDPTVVQCGGKYYRFCSGPGIPVASSGDLESWAPAGSGRVFGKNPEWTAREVPGSTDYWAPEVVRLGGRYRVYYSVSTFGSNRSAIGVASNATLDPDSPDYAWVDEGSVIESKSEDLYNCIDPCVAIDGDGVPWMSFGSFWTGIKLVKLDVDSGKLADPKAEPIAIAHRLDSVDAIEGSYILPKGGKYYLFVSFDFCCRGNQSTYNIRIGRADSIVGPYFDKEGVPMLKGGGSLIREGGDRYKGPGHNSILIDKGRYYLVYHAYDAQAGGMARFRIEPLKWDAEGWPYVTGTGAGKP